MYRFASLALCLVLATSASAESILRVGDQKGGSRALMESANVLQDVPYRIEWKEFPAAAPLLEALNAGAIDTGIVGDAPFTFAAAAGVPAKAVAAIRSDQDGLAILVPRDSQITKPEDLKGKRISTGKGSIGHQLVLAFIEKQGWPQDAVRLTFLPPSDAKVAYTTGAVDAWSTWEPYVAQEEILAGSRRVVSGVGLTPGLSFQVARDDAIAGKRAELADFLRRLAKARAWSLTHVDEYATTWANLFSLDVAIPKRWLNRARIRLAPIDATTVADEQTTIDLYARNGLIKAGLQSGQILDSSFTSAIEGGVRTGATQ